MNFVRTSALALTTTLAVLLPAAAEAASYVTPDTTGDVLKIDSNDNTTKQPDVTDGDIVRSSVAHGKRRVTVAMSHRDLVSPTSNDINVSIFRIGTNKRRIRWVQVIATAGHTSGVATLQKSSGHRVKCRGVRWNIDYPTHVVSASVPRRCLGNPKWVHVGMATGKLSSDDVVYLDDAQTNGYFGENPKWGPRVYR